MQPQGSSQPSEDNLQSARETIESLQLAELDNFFREACLGAKSQMHYTTVGESQVESTLDQLRQNLTEPDTLAQAKSLSQQVYNWLIKPALAELAQSNAKTLVFVLDGSLRNIPMAALYDGKQYLIEKYGIKPNTIGGIKWRVS